MGLAFILDEGVPRKLRPKHMEKAPAGECYPRLLEEGKYGDEPPLFKE